MEIKTKSGAELVINRASWEEAKILWEAVQRATLRNSMVISSGDPMVFVTAIDSDPEFNKALWPCLIRCTRNKIKIEKSTFEDVEAAKEYYEIISPCVEENIRPFVDSLFFMLENKQLPFMKMLSSAKSPE